MILEHENKFRFVTRTLSEDYRVFVKGGQETLNDPEDFNPLRVRGNIIPEDGPCAVLFWEEEKIFLIASGLSRDASDRAGRPIRFSFCVIFEHTQRQKAYSAFMKLIENFHEAEKKNSGAYPRNSDDAQRLAREKYSR